MPGDGPCGCSRATMSATMRSIHVLGSAVFLGWALSSCGEELFPELKQVPGNVNAVGEAEQEPRSGAEVFAVTCALCHGETGDGQGIVVLDRPARSFQEGAFSFGNTPEALFRTISAGIGGTPMPGFGATLPEVERRRVADFVISLGPEQVPAAGAASILHVQERPLFVRGQFRAPVPGAAEVPRGLMVGTLDGLSWQYRADDVRLLAVRQGGFVDRSDWGGRGGSPLKLLGKPVHFLDGGTPGPAFATDGGAPLVARLRSTLVEGDQAWLRYRLLEESVGAFPGLAGPSAGYQPGVAMVHESCSAASLPSAAGYRRSLRLEPDGDPRSSSGDGGSAAAGAARPALLLHLASTGYSEMVNGPGNTTWLRLDDADPPVVMGLQLYLVAFEGGVGQPLAAVIRGLDGATALSLPASDAPLQVEWTTLLPSTLNDATWATMVEEIQQ